jgi:chromosome partitioning protein
MRIWSFVSQKGGSGKTTLAIHLAVYAEQMGETVAIIDTDPQGSTVVWHKVRGTDAPIVTEGTPDKLPALLETARMLGVTLAIVDTAPHTDTSALVAIRMADRIVMPVRPSFLDVAALVNTVRLLDATQKKSAAVAVINAVPPRGGLADDASEALNEFGIDIAPVRIAQRNPLASAIPEGKGITEAAPRDPGADEIRALWAYLAGADATPARAKPSKSKKGK